MVAQLKTFPSFCRHDRDVAALLLEDEQRLHDETRRLLAFAVRNTSDPHLIEPLRRMLNVSGKRVRPLLPFWLLRVLDQEVGGTRGDAAARIAVVTLALHSAAIVLDDIEDGSVERQAQAALHVRHGLGPTLNAATMLIFTSLQYLRDPQLLQLAVDAIAQCHAGQALDLAFADARTALPLLDGSDAERKARWLDCGRLKTSQLMTLSIVATGRVLNAPPALIDDAVAAITSYGVAYQMLDDVKNLRPDLIGAKAYEDLPHGLCNHVFLELLAMLPADELAHVRALYGSAELVTFVVAHPELPRAIERTLGEAQTAIAAAERALGALGHTEASRDYVHELLQRPIEDLKARVDG